MIFLYGTLRHLPLLVEVLGREPVVSPARAPGWRALCVPGEVFPVLVADPQGEAEGLLLEELGDDRARLDYYELGFGYRRGRLSASPGLAPGAGAPVAAAVYLAEDGVYATAGAWSLAEFAATRGALNTAAAREYMALWPGIPAAEAALRYPQMLQRAASTLRAAGAAAPRGIRAGGGTVELLSSQRPYRKFFEVEDALLRYPRFDGRLSEPAGRAAFVMADAVTVLPYDPVRDRVLLVEQFRMGMLVRGDPLPWSLEPVAGRIDADEAPETCARREAMEEAGLALGRMIPVGKYYPSPGAVSEFIYSFIGLADLPDSAAGTGGLDEEQEDIRAHILSFEAAMAMLDRGEFETGPLLLTLLQLDRLRAGLRQAAAAG